MSVKAFIDTNVVIYSLGEKSIKTAIAATLLSENPVISTQVLSETANIAIKKLSLSLEKTGDLLTMLKKLCRVEIIRLDTLDLALDVIHKYSFSWYDSLIVAAALQADCSVLYTEDLQDGQVIEKKLKVINPFGSSLLKT